MTLHPPLLGRGISSWGVEGCTRCQSLWLRKGEGKDTAMASARLLGVILLPGEARSEEHGLRPSLLGRGSLLEQWRSVILVASSYIQKEEGREVTVASHFSSGEQRSTPPLPLYNWWRTRHLTFSYLRREEHEPPPSSSWKGGRFLGSGRV